MIIYAFCLPLATVVGFTVMSPANGPTYANSGEFGLLALILSTPVLLRWRHPLLVLSWNLPLVIFFVKGAPPVCLVMVFVSFGICSPDRNVAVPAAELQARIPARPRLQPFCHR